MEALLLEVFLAAEVLPVVEEAHEAIKIDRKISKCLNPADLTGKVLIPSTLDGK